MITNICDQTCIGIGYSGNIHVNLYGPIQGDDLPVYSRDQLVKRFRKAQTFGKNCHYVFKTRAACPINALQVMGIVQDHSLI